MQVYLRIIFNMEMELKHGLMVLFMRVNMTMARNMEKASSYGLIRIHMTANSMKMIFMDKVDIHGQTEEYTRVVGSIIAWKERVFSPG